MGENGRVGKNTNTGIKGEIWEKVGCDIWEKWVGCGGKTKHTCTWCSLSSRLRLHASAPSKRSMQSHGRTVLPDVRLFASIVAEISAFAFPKQNISVIYRENGVRHVGRMG